MVKFIGLWACIGILAVQPANAQTFTPAGTYALTGNVVFNQSFAQSCTLSMTLNVPSTPSSSATATTGTPPFRPGGLLCASLTVTGAPHIVTFDPATSQLSLSGFVINTPLTGSCGGTLSGVWNNATKQMTINTSLPGIGAAAPCTVVGTLAAPSGLSIS